jgi:hypothetical protein
MLRAKPSSRRPSRRHRALRVEQLETRTMLSTNGVIGPPTPVITFMARHTIGDVWDLEGTVREKGVPVAGMTVTFGGVLAKYHLTAKVQANGTFRIAEVIPVVVTGAATAQTVATDGKHSNVAMALILHPIGLNHNFR